MESNYEINRGTLALIPINNDLTKIIEIEDQLVVNAPLSKIIDESCKVFGSSYQGRYEGTKKLIGTSYKSPIIVSESNEMIFFPTASPNVDKCCWISLKNITKYEKNNHKTTIHFNNNQKLDLEVSYFSMENQIYKAMMLEAKLRKVKSS